jgi:NAD(P)-dependent dehydrogenase (short-subunit alcohol dehydrogenase family)
MTRQAYTQELTLTALFPLTSLYSLTTLVGMSPSTSTTKWTPADLPSLDGRTVVITGATSGIGRAAAVELSRAGARVVLAVRNTDRGEQVAKELANPAEVQHLDLTDLAGVRKFASLWSGDIAILINNAGIMAVPEGRTTDGFETQIGTNHLGHFALTGLLLEHVTDRVVTLASGAHRMGKIDLEDLNWERRTYRRWPAYGQSKLANLLFTFELQRRLAESGSPVRAVAAHPGWAATELQQRTGNRIWNAINGLGNRVLAQSGEQGAWPTLFAATQELPGGAYIGPGGPGELRGSPAPASRSSAARDDVTARELWALSERLTGVTYAFESSAAAASVPSRTA